MNHNYTPHNLQKQFNTVSKKKIVAALKKTHALNLLTSKDRSLIKTLHAINNQTLYAKSYLIYLANAIIEETEVHIIKKLKQQLAIELAVTAALHTRTSISIDAFQGFILALNESVPVPVGSVQVKGQSIVFETEYQEHITIPLSSPYLVSDTTRVLQEDHNPYNTHNAHPDVAFKQYDLGNKSFDEWVTQFKEAFAVLHTYDKQTYQEITPFLDSVVPMGYLEGKQLSSSYSKSPGILYLSYTDTTLKQAEALVHEVNHTIYNIIKETDPILLNEPVATYYSAYRPDPRPLQGIFIGLHAFISVQHFYARIIVNIKNNSAHTSSTTDLYDQSVEAFLDFYIKNEHMIDLITKYAKFTQKGKDLFDDLLEKHTFDQIVFEQLTATHSTRIQELTKSISVAFESAKIKYPYLIF